MVKSKTHGCFLPPLLLSFSGLLVLSLVAILSAWERILLKVQIARVGCIAAHLMKHQCWENLSMSQWYSCLLQGHSWRQRKINGKPLQKTYWTYYISVTMSNTLPGAPNSCPWRQSLSSILHQYIDEEIGAYQDNTGNKWWIQDYGSNWYGLSLYTMLLSDLLFLSNVSTIDCIYILIIDEATSASVDSSLQLSEPSFSPVI